MRKMEILSVFWHSVEPDSIHPHFLTGLNPTASRFREQLRFLLDNYHPISIREFVDVMEMPSLRRSYRKPPVLLTFDDGFKNVIEQALPILAEFGVPAVFFVIGEVIKNPEFVPWFVEITHLIRRTSKKTMSYGTESINLTVQTGRRRLANLVSLSLSRAGSDADRTRLLIDFAELLDVERPARKDLDDDLHFVGPEQLRKLDSSSLLTVASHAMTHRFLGHLTAEEQRSELQRSHIFLSEASPSYFPALAYPYGSFNPETIELAKETYRCAFGTESGCKNNRYAYLRIYIGRANAEHAAYAISERRRRYVLPFKRFLDSAKKWGLTP